MRATRFNPNDELLELIAEQEADDAGGSFYPAFGCYLTADQWDWLDAENEERAGYQR